MIIHKLNSLAAWLAVSLLLLTVGAFAQTAQTVASLNGLTTLSTSWSTRPPELAQSNGTLKGQVTLGDGGKAVHGVRVTIIQLKRTTETDEAGNYEFQNVPPGKYDVTAHLEGTPDVVQQVEIGAS